MELEESTDQSWLRFKMVSFRIRPARDTGWMFHEGTRLTYMSCIYIHKSAISSHTSDVHVLSQCGWIHRDAALCLKYLPELEGQPNSPSVSNEVFHMEIKLGGRHTYIGPV